MNGIERATFLRAIGTGGTPVPPDAGFVGATLPVKIYSDEDYAKSKFNIAHLLWLNGRVEAARGVLAKLLDDYRGTTTAERARVVKERF